MSDQVVKLDWQHLKAFINAIDEHYLEALFGVESKHKLLLQSTLAFGKNIFGNADLQKFQKLLSDFSSITIPVVDYKNESP
jgi:hypothetical protein